MTFLERFSKTLRAATLCSDQVKYAASFEGSLVEVVSWEVKQKVIFVQKSTICKYPYGIDNF